ncbi:MAG: VRR-NUC domain-containing protein [Prochlorococcaceae cyanobacterium]
MAAADTDAVANAETELQQRIRLALGTRPDVRLFRNQVGQLPDPRTGRPVQFGLARGSADLIGWRTITITPDMVGQRLAVFTSLEIKTTTGRLTPAQHNWLHAVRGAGGIAGVARSVQDSDEILRSVANLPTLPPNSDGS